MIRVTKSPQRGVTIKNSLFVLIAAAVPLLFTTCSGDEGYVFRYGNAQNESDPRSVSMKFFKEELEKRTEGRITVQNHFGGTLGTEREMADAVAMGAGICIEDDIHVQNVEYDLLSARLEARGQKFTPKG